MVLQFSRNVIGIQEVEFQVQPNPGNHLVSKLFAVLRKNIFQFGLANWHEQVCEPARSRAIGIGVGRWLSSPDGRNNCRGSKTPESRMPRR